MSRSGFELKIISSVRGSGSSHVSLACLMLDEYVAWSWRGRKLTITHTHTHSYICMYACICWSEPWCWPRFFEVSNIVDFIERCVLGELQIVYELICWILSLKLISRLMLTKIVKYVLDQTSNYRGDAVKIL